EADNSNGGTLTHQLIDTLSQRTDQLSWQGNNGVNVTRAPNGTLTQTNPDGTVITQTSAGVITQTNPDHSSVSYDPSTGTVTTNDGQGTTTIYDPNGTVLQTNGATSTLWDSNGNGSTYNSFDGLGIPSSTSDPAPTPPSVPNGVTLPHDPNAPAPST